MEWVAISYSRGFSQSRNQTHFSCVFCIGGQILYPLCHLRSLTLLGLHLKEEGGVLLVNTVVSTSKRLSCHFWLPLQLLSVLAITKALQKKSYFLATPVRHIESLFLYQGSNPHPLHWEHGVLTTGPPGNSLKRFFCLFVSYHLRPPAVHSFLP